MERGVTAQVTQEHASEATLTARLRHFLQALDAAGQAVKPDSADALLQSIVEAAARIFGAAASSVALLDEQAGTLTFVMAYGVGREAVVGMCIPAGQGIAGYVAMTGQPLAVSEVQRDPRFAHEFARDTGYVPRSILAMPLLSGERVIGVMEVLDKLEAPSFGLRDMELLSLFARQAAIAIDQTRRWDHLTQALVLGLRRTLTDEEVAWSSGVIDELLRLAGRDEAADPRSKDLLALADLFRALAELGTGERRMALRILGTIADYVQARTSHGGGRKS